MRSRVVLGLMSGTSADGVDAAACAIAGRGLSMRVRYLDHVSRPYPADLRRRILAVMAPAATRTEEICRLNVEIGRAFADAATRLIKRLGRRRVELIGSHGQTVCHLPPGREEGKRAIAGTLQIGDPAIIAARTGIPVVAHFREADMAVGGQGAPLVPWTDWILFRHPKKNRIIQNIGGIANLTWLPAGCRPEDVIAFDTGPGNMVMDALVRRFTNGRDSYDANGSLAAMGKPIYALLTRMINHPYFRLHPPKSCGREQFGDAYTAALLQTKAARGAKLPDLLATAAHCTANTIFDAYCDLLEVHRAKSVEEIILAGGGARNGFLTSILHDVCPIIWSSCDLTDAEAHGIPIFAKEAVSFAILAAACVDRVPANLPRVTGARRAVVLGQVCHA